MKSSPDHILKSDKLQFFDEQSSHDCQDKEAEGQIAKIIGNLGYYGASSITLAHSMELEVVAEGVETMEQLQYLYRQGCDLIQGFLFKRPMSFNKVDVFDQINPDIKQYLDTQPVIV